MSATVLTFTRQARAVAVDFSRDTRIITLAIQRAGVPGPAGASGPAGTGLQIDATVATAAALPADAADGLIVATLDNQHAHLRESGAWTDLGTYVGPAGADGDPGADGEDGADGADGVGFNLVAFPAASDSPGNLGDLAVSGPWLALYLDRWYFLPVSTQRPPV